MNYLVNIEKFPKYQYMIGCRIAFSDISSIAFFYLQDQITTDGPSQLVVTGQIVYHMIS